MDKFKEVLLLDKLISVWGIGYLGYTKTVKLQSKGFNVNIFDVTQAGFGTKGNFSPDSEQIYSWSLNAHVPVIDSTKARVVSAGAMFDSNVHFLAFPPMDRDGRSFLRELAAVFIEHRGKLENALVIFQSAGVPGMIDRQFIDILYEHGVNCSFASAFRDDWTIEEYFYNDKTRVVAAKNEKSLNKARLIYDMLGVKYKTLSNIKEAEVYENAKNSLQYVAAVFTNQLGIAYPDVNIRKMAEYLMNGVALNETHLGIGAGGYKMFYSVKNILDGSKKPHMLSLIKEVHNNNLSMILHYAEAIANTGCKSATILGLTTRGNQKNIELSPSVILGEYLNRLGVAVHVDDPFYTEAALTGVFPFFRSTDILKDGLKSDALFVMADHNKFKYISQAELHRLGIFNAAVVIDNVPLFREFRFSDSTIYHAVGDGRPGLI
jgi:UDP-N-acetyl-D-mannosaminuronate dehydrogenase